MNEEGWYIDPFGRHEARWISDGQPTALVRDGPVEAQDPPPGLPITGPLERVAESVPPNGDDLRRADDAEAKEFDPKSMTDAASEAIDSATGL
jgi:hypothetical protein